MSRKGIPTPESVQANAKRTYEHFSPTNVRDRLGIGRKDTFFYVYGFTPDQGRAICWGPIPEGLDMARAAAKGLVGGEVFELDTRDLKRAKSEIKAELLRRGANPDEALKRLYGKPEEEKPAKRSIFSRLTRR